MNSKAIKKNKLYFLKDCVRTDSPTNEHGRFICGYYNGVIAIVRYYEFGQDIPTIIYDNE